METSTITQEPSLLDKIEETFKELNISEDNQKAINSYLDIIKLKDIKTYEHSLRVGILARNIARYMHLDQKALFYAGILHDVGKALTKLDTLQKTDSWTEEDSKEIAHHVMDSYKLLRNKFDYSSEVILWHHRFQQNGYPEILPEPLHEYCQGTKVQIAFYGRLLAIADVFDALHRINSKFGQLSSEQIREKMFLFNPDQKVLITNLYDEGILQ